jgi:ribosomal protein L32
MIWKILLLVAAIAAVLYGFRYMNRVPDRGARQARREKARAERTGNSDGQAVDLVKCDGCGAFIAPKTACSHCGAG